MADTTGSQQQLITNRQNTQEYQRLIEDQKREQYWKRWGPYVSDRQWGTVREDYSDGGAAWEYFPHDQARSRSYRWGEDGIMGISDNHQRLCFAIALWNGKDPILKERLFGLTNSEGNHGEDVKEYYFYLDNTPSHAYMKGLYKYPQGEFPYAWLVNENGSRKKNDPAALEFELMDTGVFDEDRYFDVFVEYAKNTPEDILIKISVINRGSEVKPLHLLPTLWFRNTWSWGGIEAKSKPSLKDYQATPTLNIIEADFSDPELEDRSLNKKWLYCEQPHEVLYTENETNKERFENWGLNDSPYVKDGINNYITKGNTGAVNPNKTGTKASSYYKLDIAPGETKVVRLRLSDSNSLTDPFGSDFENIFQKRQQEAEEFYQAITPFDLPDEMRKVQRQAFAGMLWSKQFFHYVVQDWLNTDTPPPSKERIQGRNHDWTHLFNEDIISMPDKWEYPWFAAWDLAFHTIPLALIDPEFAKQQLYLFTREWYQHPNGQLPAYEWNFSDVNPPVHAWAAWRVYQIEQKMYGRTDRAFLEEVFQKLSLYFTWWVNRKDTEGNNLFSGGFLGLDNIGIIDRSNLNIDGPASIEQSDGTSWMGMFCLNLLKISTELAKGAPEPKVYEDMASKFFQHFLLIADALNKIGGPDIDIWDNQDDFYYDILRVPANVLPSGNDAFAFPMKVQSMVGLIPLFAVESIDAETLNKYLKLDFRKRFEWFLTNRSDLTEHQNIYVDKPKDGSTSKGVALALVDPEKLRLILQRMLNEAEFLSPHGIRALSKVYSGDNRYKLPFQIRVIKDGWRREYISPEIEYEPAESRFGLFGGNSNWRGPVWMPVNFLIIESLQKYHYYLGDSYKVEFPANSGNMMTLWEVASELSQRLITIFLPDVKNSNKRPVYGESETFQTDPHWRDFVLFYEYFHGDIGAGIGASHQTGWTGVVAKLIQQYGEYVSQGKDPDTL